jgi:hypothetical protein
VEFAVDYAAGTCRVAFYTPEVAAGGFVEAPHAKMELRFIATEAIFAPPRGRTPPVGSRTAARPDPTRADVLLNPAVAPPRVRTPHMLTWTPLWPLLLRAPGFFFEFSAHFFHSLRLIL